MKVSLLCLLIAGGAIASDQAQLKWSGWGRDGKPTPNAHCEGDCDYNHQCANGGVCMHDLSQAQLHAWGCTGSKYYSSAADYCIVKTKPTPSPTKYPTPYPTKYPTPKPTNFPTPSPTNYPTPAPTPSTEELLKAKVHASAQVCTKTTCKVINGHTNVYDWHRQEGNGDHHHCVSDLATSKCICFCGNANIMSSTSKIIHDALGTTPKHLHIRTSWNANPNDNTPHYYGGTCANGSLIAPALRTQVNHCGSCNSGYKLTGKSCVAQCTPSFTGNCWMDKNNNVVNCASNQYFDGVSKTCQACPQYSKCKNGVVVMRTIRTTTRSGGPTAQQTFKLPQMNVAKCQLSVRARQTDYDSSSEWLQIIHLDGTSQALNTKCGFNQQCHQNLHTCKLSTNVVLVDQGADDEITIQGKHAPSTDYCPYDPTRDGYPNNKSPQSRQGHGACGARGTGPTCYYMWAEVTLDNCY